MAFVFPEPGTIARASTGLVRAIFGLVTTSAGWMLIGTGLLLSGLIWGLNSHQVSYVAGNQGIYVVSAYDGVSTFRQPETGDLYVIQDKDFQPGFASAFASSTYAVPQDVHFLASSDLVFVGWGVGFAHPIEKVTFDGATAVSTEYQQHPHGYTVNNWPYASLLMLTGMLCLGLSVDLLTRARKRQKRATAAKLAALTALPSPFARELGEKRMQTGGYKLLERE